MSPKYSRLLDQISALGWTAERETSHESASVLEARYAWIPDSVRDFLSETRALCSPDEKVWINTCAHINGRSGFAFAWNEWELLSVQAAREDQDELLAGRIAAFWDEHLPVLMSVKSGYAFFALTKDGRIVRGEEPEFEETIPLADGFEEMLRMIVEQNQKLSRWV